jgi:hypothetical protein
MSFTLPRAHAIIMPKMFRLTSAASRDEDELSSFVVTLRTSPYG